MVKPSFYERPDTRGAAQGVSGVPTEGPVLTLAMSLKPRHSLFWFGLESLPCGTEEFHWHCEKAGKNYHQKKKAFQQSHLSPKIYIFFSESDILLIVEENMI